MRRAVLTALAVIVVGCSHSAAPQIAQQQPLVPSILQTGTPPLQWAQIPTNEPSGDYIQAIARDPNGKEWFTEHGTGGEFIGYVSMNRAVTEWSVNGGDIVAGPDGNMWFTAIAATWEVDSITSAGVITHHPQSTPATDICNGPDGNLWFTAAQDGIARLTTSGVATVFPIGGAGYDTANVCHKGPDGRVWFGQHNSSTGASALGAIDPATGYISTYNGVNGLGGTSIASGPDGNVWVSSGSTIHKVTTSGTVTSYQLPTGETAARLVSGPDGNIWFAGGHGVGEITTAGAVVGWHPDPLLAKGQGFISLSAGSDGNLWMGASTPAQIGVFIHRVLTASPSPVVLTAGTNTTLTIKETHYNNTFTVESADPSVATASATTRTTYTVSGVAHGSTTLTIADKYGNSLVVGVTVN